MAGSFRNWKCDDERGAEANFARAVYGPAQSLRDQVVNDIQTQPAAAFAAASGKERIEYLRHDVLRHTLAIVSVRQLATAIRHHDLNRDLAAFIVGIGVNIRIHYEVRYDLGDRPRVARDGESVVALKGNVVPPLFQLRRRLSNISRTYSATLNCRSSSFD